MTYRCTPGLTVELVVGGGGLTFKNNIKHVYNTLSFTILMEMFTQLIILGVCGYQLLFIYTRYFVALFIKQDTCQVQLKMYLLHSLLLLFCFLFVFFSISLIFLALHRLIIQLDFWTNFSCKLFFPFSKFKFFFYKTKLCKCIIFSKISFMYI